MNKILKRLINSTIVIMLFIAIVFTYVQFGVGSFLKNHPKNSRVLYSEYSHRRGQIDAEDELIASSRRTDSYLTQRRIYPSPYAIAFANITGYYSLWYGRSGLEKSFDHVLAGSDARLRGSNILDELAGHDPRGGSVVTTINAKLQLATYNAMVHGCQGHGCTGAAVAIEPDTGKILALVSTPSFNPNLLVGENSQEASKHWKQINDNPTTPLINRPLQKIYPPGSTFKVITTAIALEQGITPRQYLTAEPSIVLPHTATRLTNYNSTPCPEAVKKRVTLLQAFQYSCNTAFVDLATAHIAHPRDNFQTLAHKFHIDLPSFKVNLPSATSTLGSMPDLAAIGQSAIGQRDVALTPLTNAVIAASVANHGKIMRPYLIDSIKRPDLQTIDKTLPHPMEQAFSPHTAATLTELMRASEKHTLGYDEHTEYTIASKTGTAEHGSNTPGPHGWYIAFAHNDNKKIAIAVIVEDGGGLGHQATGATLAAPIGRTMIHSVLGGE